MRIGLIADTHIPEIEPDLPPEVLDAFQGVDLILHAGDIYDPFVLDKLATVAPVLASIGDDDGDHYPDDRVKDRHILNVEGKVIWLVHQRAFYLITARTEIWQDRIHNPSNKKNTPDIMVCGHEHRVITQQNDGILYINPGSPTFLEYSRGLGTVGILEINSGKVDTEIIQLK